MADYLTYMNQYTETMAKMDAMENSELSDVENEYFIEAQIRINNMLMEVAQ